MVVARGWRVRRTTSELAEDLRRDLDGEPDVAALRFIRGQQRRPCPGRALKQRWWRGRWRGPRPPRAAAAARGPPSPPRRRPVAAAPANEHAAAGADTAAAAAARGVVAGGEPGAGGAAAGRAHGGRVLAGDEFLKFSTLTPLNLLLRTLVYVRT